MGKVFINPNFHVILVHFPLGIFLLGVLIELLSFMYRRSTLKLAGRWMILLGALATIPVAFSGIYALNDIAVRSQADGRTPGENATWKQVASGARLRDGHSVEPITHLTGMGISSGDAHSVQETQQAWQMLSRHVWVEGSASGLIALIVVVFLGASDRMRRRLYYPFMVLLLAGAGLMGWGAWYAGESIYTLGAATRLQKSTPVPAESPAAVTNQSAPGASASVSIRPAGDVAGLAANPLPQVPPFRLIAEGIVSPTSEPSTAPTTAPPLKSAAAEPVVTEPAIPASAATSPAVAEPATAPTTAPATSPASRVGGYRLAPEDLQGPPTSAPASEPATAPAPTTASVPLPASEPTTVPVSPTTTEATPVTVPSPDTTATTLPATMPATIAAPTVPPAGIIPPAFPTTVPATTVVSTPPVVPSNAIPSPRDLELSKVEDPTSPAYYAGPPLQIHVLLAGLAVAIALGALGASWRRLSLLTAEAAPVSEAEAAALEAEEAEALAANQLTGTRPVTGEDVDLVRSFKPGLTVGPVHAEIVPASRLWLLAFLAVLLTAGVGIYVLGASPTLGGDNTGWNTNELWSAIANNPKDNPLNPEGPVTRRFAHVIGGGALLLFPLLLAIFARWSRSRILLAITSFLLVVIVAAQVWLGILLLYDTRVGNITHFNSTSNPPVPTHVQSAST